MPLDNKPPDPILEEFSTLTGMSSKSLSHIPVIPFGDSIPLGLEGFASAGAGAILKRLRNSKMDGKGRSLSDSSSCEDVYGERPNSSSILIDEALSKVLDRIAYNKSVSKQMVFYEGICDSGNAASDLVNKFGHCSIDDPLLVSNDASKLTMADVEHGKVESVRKANKDMVDGMNGESGFMFGDVQRNKGILNRPPIGMTKVQFGPSLFYKSSNAWSSNTSGVGVKADRAMNIESFAGKMKKGVEDRELQMKFDPQAVSTQGNGTKKISISVEDIEKGSVDCALQLYGYFVGTSMDYRVFKNEEGVKAVLESGPWMINNVPLVLNVWEPGIWLQKVKPSMIPIWVCVYGIPLELCNGNGIGKIMIGVGKPILMDKLTRERCVKKASKLDFARVLVEVLATDELPQVLEIEYPSIGDRPGRIVRPRFEEEIAAGIIKDVLNVNKSMCGKENSEKMDTDSFVEVGKKNELVGGQNFGKHNGYYNRYNFSSSQSRGFQTYNRINGSSGRTNFASRGPNQHDRNGSAGGRNQSNGWKVKGIDKSIGLKKGNDNVMSDAVSFKKNSLNQHDVKSGNILKPSLMSKYNAYFQPNVLVRGSGSSMQVNVKGKNVLVSNSFQALEDQDMVDKEECFLSSVDEEFKSNWSLSQLAFFYNNCSKFGLAPYVDNDDVKGLNNDLNQNQAIDMIRNGSYSIYALLETKLKKNKLSRNCSKVMGSLVVKDAHWVLLRDFNVILEPSERSFGYSYISAGMEEFRSCIAKKGVSDLVIVMCNMGFLDKFPNANAVFLSFVCSDHSPSVLNIPNIAGPMPKPIKFANFLASKAEFLPIVKSVWEKDVLCFAMFSLGSKLKLLKKPLRKLKFVQGNLVEKVQSLKVKLFKVQEDMIKDPFNEALRVEEVEVLKAFFAAAKDKELFLKQRSKITWLNLDGNSFSRDSVRDQFLKHFESVLGRREEVVPIHEPSSLFINKLSMMDADLMVKHVSLKEIKDVLFSMNDDKASGPDGFSAKFFKGAWSIMGAEFSQAILDFFSNGKLLKEINSIVIVLVPKPQTLKRVSDFRPISCCNIVYKCISKFITNRINGSLNSLVDDCQSAFIPSRQISYNILLSQELMRNCHRKSGPSKVSFKIDIQKAYDSVDWGFFRQCLIHFVFPWKMINWIMNCMTSPSYTICVNGDYYGYFKGDLLIFSHGDVKSMSVIKSASEEFSNISGLKPSMEKSLVFFGNVPDPIKAYILEIMAFSIRSGCSSHFFSSLSLQVYWSYVFILPKFVSSEIEKLMRGFLWSQGDSLIGKAKMKWYDVCILKEHGSLGPLCQFISKMDIFKAGLSLSCNIADVVKDGEWIWPSYWRSKFEFLFVMPPPLLFQDRLDKVLWKSRNNKHFKDLMRLDAAPDNIFYIIEYFSSSPVGKSIWSIIQRLVLGASVYYLWVERNNKIFQRISRSVEDICSIISDVGNKVNISSACDDFGIEKVEFEWHIPW
ncbi:hypothetical protein Tco_0047646 [Tanacetum coccineum]